MSYRRALLAGGISEADALQLTINFQTLLLAPIFGSFGAGGAT